MMMDRYYIKQMFNDDSDTGSGNADAPEGKEAEKEAEERKYTDADLDRIINQRFARWQRAQEKKISEAEKLANMTAEEKMKALETELADLKRDKALAEISKTARGILADDGITVSDDILTMLVSDDADKTAAACKAYSSAFKTAVQAAVKDALRGNAPKAGSGSGTDEWTKEKIMAVQDIDKRQQLIREHMSLFRQ